MRVYLDSGIVTGDIRPKSVESREFQWPMWTNRPSHARELALRVAFGQLAGRVVNSETGRVNPYPRVSRMHTVEEHKWQSVFASAPAPKVASATFHFHRINRAAVTPFRVVAL